jgi:hypothetical protein
LYRGRSVHRSANVVIDVDPRRVLKLSHDAAALLA